MGKPQSAVFIGHGNPMNALEDNAYTGGWAAIGRKSRPKPSFRSPPTGTSPGPGDRYACSPDDPRFRRLSPELYQVRYPAPGDPALAGRVRDLLAPLSVRRDRSGGWITGHGLTPPRLPPGRHSGGPLSIDERAASFHSRSAGFSPPCATKEFSLSEAAT